MLHHLFTLIWNRKRSNLLLIVEIMLSFFVLFAVNSLLLYNLYYYRQPLGFNYQNVWKIHLSPGADTTNFPLKLQHTMQRLKATKGVVALSKTSSNTPFSFSGMSGRLRYQGKPSLFTKNYDADDAFQEVLKLHMIEGRWFDKRDMASTRQPIIINQAFQNALFPGEKAVGKILTDAKGENESQVIGVVDYYRRTNDFAEDEPANFRRRALDYDVSPVKNSYERPTFLVRVQPGSGARLEQQLIKEIASVAKGWTVTVNSLAQDRVSQLKVVLTPFIVLGLVCGFLILNVGLGLLGVLWLNISRRRSEIGIRRAMGATASAISSQIVGEIVVVTTLGLLVGLLVAVQFPLLGALGVPASVYLTAIGFATALIYGLAVLCALYPSRLAAGIHPAVVLREE
ncbi:FtsX-like permease family protein [Hymenobacter sp. YC55]|uniref:FtsX-like permease family protein n=1 Tax=Hymenobacter sp. YC55 TaxID=3034019 RepID=UPI0023F8ECF9|nr:FtsX-like permease family protein [Hymenobacter sp. YC55]MDF7815898.1 ABC transporter permease [Hymenobacter sp. YC55]